MESLAFELRKLCPTIDSLLSTTSANASAVGLLAALPPTAEIAAEHAAAQAALARLTESAPVTRAKAATLVQALALRLEQAARRDTLAAARPAGCWCLGLGGRGARYVPALSDDEEPAAVWDTYCPCPDGAQRQVEDDVHRAHYRAYQAAHRVRRLFQTAGIPAHFAACSFETYPVTDASAPALAAVRAWADGEASRPSLFLYGDFGRGKTGLAIAAMRCWMTRRAEAALFITTPDLLDRIRATYDVRAAADRDGPTERDVLTAAREVPLLVLDDLGAERPTDWVQEKLFGIINARHDERRATLFTSNLSATQLAAHIGERIVNRIIEMAEAVEVIGANLRVPAAS